MKVVVINNALRHEFQFSKPIMDLVKKFLDDYRPNEGHKVEVVHWEDVNRGTKEGVDAIIVTGSSQGDKPMESHTPKYMDLGMHDLEVRPF